MNRLRLFPPAALLSALLLAACGTDDGTGVREVGTEGGAASGSGSGSAASGSGSGSAASGSGSGSGASPAASGEATAQGSVTPAFGGYSPVSDVTQHARVALDVCAINELLPDDGTAIDYDAVLAVYEEGGSSTNSEGAPRTIRGFATTERDEALWSTYAEHYADPLWLDTYTLSAIEGSGAFEGEPDLVRRQGIQKGIRNATMVAWMFHELVAAVDLVADGDVDPAEGAPHRWDEAWAFYHGAEPDCAPYATADSRGENFGTGTAVNEAILAAMQEGLQATLDGDAAAAQAAVDEIVRQVTITYAQATIRYAAQMEAAVAEGDAEGARVQQAEGGAFWRVIEPLVAAADPEAATAITAVYDLTNEPGAAAADVLAAMESTYEDLAIDPAEIGVLE